MRLWRRRTTIRVSLRETAARDLDELFDYLREAAGARVARLYVNRLLDLCDSLAELPERGAPRDDLSKGLRLLGFERRVAIAYRVDTEIEIVRVLYGGRDLPAILGDPDEF